MLRFTPSPALSSAINAVIGPQRKPGASELAVLRHQLMTELGDDYEALMSAVETVKSHHHGLTFIDGLNPQNQLHNDVRSAFAPVAAVVANGPT